MHRRKKFLLTTSFLLFSLVFSIINSAPTLIHTHAFKLAEQTNAAVDAIAVWQHGEIGAHDIWYSIWDDSNNQWWVPSSVEASPIAELTGDDVDPAIAFDRQGTAIAVWSHETGNPSLGFDIWYSKWSGSDWAPPTEVSSLPGNDADPAIAFDTNGWAITIWVHNGTFINYSLWDGTNWIGPAQAIVPDWPSLPFWKGSYLPEIAFTSKKASGYTSNKAVAIWTLSIAYPEVPPQLISRIYYAVWDGTNWSPSPAEEISGQAYDAAKDGTPAIFRNGISSDNLNNAVAVWATENITRPIYYASWDGRIWSDATALDDQEAYGYMPAIAFDFGNDAILTFTHNTTNLWHSRYVSGGWQLATEAADSGGDDSRSSIAFLINNKAVAVWSSDVEAFAPSEIFSSTWDPATGVWTTASSIVPQGLSGSDSGPSIASISGSPTMPPTGVPPERHDVAIIGVDPSETVVAQSYQTLINVTVENQGTFTETFVVTVYANANTIGVQTVTNLGAGARETLVFSWDTVGLSYGTYIIKAVADTVSGETDTADNLYTDGTVLVTIPGDVNGDRIVDIFDIGFISVHWYPGPPTGSLGYDETNVKNVNNPVAVYVT